MRTWKLGALAALALLTAGCGGCGTIAPVLNPNQGVLERTIIDEQALGLAYGAATLANTAAKNAADAGLLTAAQAKELQGYRQTLRQGLSAAQAAYDAGDAKSYGDKIKGVRATIDAITKLVAKEPAR